MVEAGPEELDELADHALLAQHLGDGEDEIGRQHALAELAGQLEADHLRHQHRQRLAEHRGLGLDAADTPAEHGQAVGHGGVAVGADQRVGIGKGLAVALGGPDRLRQIFEIDLVANAGARRHHAEIGERPLPPFQEIIAFAVLLVFAGNVVLQRTRVAEMIDHDGMIDHEIDRHQRIDPRGIAAQPLHPVAHRREVDHRGHAGEILHQHARGTKADLGAGRSAVLGPPRQRLDIGARHGLAVLEPQQVLQQYLE